MDQFVLKHKWATSLCINLLFFLLANLFLFPVFNSGDDFFLMYTLAGGYGEAPTNLLQYDHIWHPVLGWVIKTLFISFPKINWYTTFILFLQILSCTIILYVLLQKITVRKALLLYIIFFFFIELRSLLSINFTSTAWISAVAGFMFLLEAVSKQKSKTAIVIISLLLLITGLLRLHVLIAVNILFIPAFLIYGLRGYKKWGIAIAVVWVILLVLNIQHKDFYKENIDGWQKQEKYRQSLFYMINSRGEIPGEKKEKILSPVEQAFLSSAFFIDTSLLSASKFNQIGQMKRSGYKFNVHDFARGIYWLFIDLRVYILLFFIGLFIAWQIKTLKKLVWKLTRFILFTGGAYFFLLIFYKMTPALHLGFMMIVWVYLVFVLSSLKLGPTKMTSRIFYSTILLVVPLAWMVIRIVKNDNANRSKHSKFECFVSEINLHPDKLFIATDDLLPFAFYYIWDAPANNKISNLIYKDRVMTFTYWQTLKRFGILNPVNAIYKNPDVFLIGNDLPELKDYFLEKYKLTINISPRLDEYNCLKVKKIGCIAPCE